MILTHASKYSLIHIDLSHLNYILINFVYYEPYRGLSVMIFVVIEMDLLRNKLITDPYAK
ncbi:MAG: hypothetical protein K0Q51_1379 [Rickettsiaceae bacterium]|jgi:hypothetical protein|nr:hypothetical protein [Rickettsiaceae bacterium]